MMRHPIYSVVNIDLLRKNIHILNKNGMDFSSLPESKIMTESAYSKYATIALIIIDENYNTIVSGGDYDWNSKISSDTLKKISYNDIVMPFMAGTVITKENVYFFVDLRNEKVEKNHILISTSTKGKKQFTANIDSNESYQKFIDTVDSEFFAILTYYSMFKSDITRVSYPKRIVSKRSKKAPTHDFNVITLNQKITINDSEAISKRDKSDRTWIVKGHFRNQYYSKTKTNKPKWIDSYWKGSGTKVVNKFYRLEK